MWRCSHLNSISSSSSSSRRCLLKRVACTSWHGLSSVAAAGPPTRCRRKRRQPVQASNQQPQSGNSGDMLDNERVIAAFTSIGLNGCLAVLGAKLAHVDLWGQCRFSQAADLQLAAAVGLLLVGYEFALLALPWHLGLRGSSSTSSSISSQPVRKEPSPDSTTDIQAASSSSNSGGSSGTLLRSPFNLQLPAALMVPGADNTVSLALLRYTLALQQACFVATATMMRSPPLPLPVDVGLIVLRESAKELLQRGLLVTFVAGWLADRLFEAGAEDAMQLLGRTYYTTDTCWAATAMLATLLLLPPVLSDAKALSLSVATNWAVMATQAGDESSDDQLLQEYRLYDALQRTVEALPARFTLAAHSLRGILRFATINAVFAATHNLAASWSVAVGTNLLLLAYSVYGKQQLGLSAETSGSGKPKSKRRAPSLKWPPDSD